MLPPNLRVNTKGACQLVFGPRLLDSGRYPLHETFRFSTRTSQRMLKRVANRPGRKLFHLLALPDTTSRLSAVLSPASTRGRQAETAVAPTRP